MQELVKLFTPEVLTLLVIVAFVVVLWMLNTFFAAMRKTEFFKQNEMFMTAIAQKALEFILHVEYGEEYASVAEEYETKANQRTVDGLFYVDPRMLFVIDKLETFVNQKFDVHLEFDDLLAIAEAKYRQIKLDPSNDLLAPKS